MPSQPVLHFPTDFLPESGDCLVVLRPHFLLHLVRARAIPSGIVHGTRIGILDPKHKYVDLPSAVPLWRARRTRYTRIIYLALLQTQRTGIERVTS